MYIKKGKSYFGKKDTWCMDEVLAPIIAEGLLKFKEAWCKSPLAGLNGKFTQWCVDVGMVSHLDNQADYSDEDWNKMEQVYLYILDEIIYAFSSEEPDIFGVGNVWEEYNKRCAQGRVWFAEYFHSLWI